MSQHGDSIQVERLKKAGAIVRGKTSTPEFGFTGITKNLVYGVYLDLHGGLTGHRGIKRRIKRNLMNNWCAALIDAFDLLITPTVPYDPHPAKGPFPEETEGRKQPTAGVAVFSSPFNQSGHPAATMRVGFPKPVFPSACRSSGRVIEKIWSSWRAGHLKLNGRGILSGPRPGRTIGRSFTNTLPVVAVKPMTTGSVISCGGPKALLKRKKIISNRFWRLVHPNESVRPASGIRASWRC